MWQVTKRELADRKWSLVAFSVGSLILLWLYAATFKSSQIGTQQLQELVKSYPKGLLSALGLDKLTFNTVEEYLNAKHFSLLWPLLAIMLALSRAANQIAGDIQNGTMGLLLSLPLSRWRIFAAKYLAGVITILVFAAVSVYGVIPLAMPYDIPTHWHVLTAAWILTSVFTWTIYSFAIAISSWVSEKSRVYAIVSGVLILSYVAYILAAISDKFIWLRYYSLFYYYNSQQVLSSGSLAKSNMLFFALIIVIFSGYAVVRFNKRDISV